MKNILCLVGRHSWQHHVNHEMGGRGAGYDLCTRCGKERASYDKSNPAFKGLLWARAAAGRRTGWRSRAVDRGGGATAIDRAGGAGRRPGPGRMLRP